MILITKNSLYPKKLYIVRDLIVSLDTYFENIQNDDLNFKNVIKQLEDYKDLLFVIFNANIHNKMTHYQQDSLKDRIVKIWNLFDNDNVKIVDTEGKVIFENWIESPRAK